MQVYMEVDIYLVLRNLKTGTKYPNGRVEQGAEYTGLALRRKIWFGLAMCLCYSTEV